ncbi:NAD(P)/FAD-dependent oxidoreductase [Candidatus Cetobacterium colombiensis]|uniref:FAD-dependent oxidoreductase n=1 Tax=Candidatus Cetobacterium colombiensis TaxID=3073100 RepID=A0ABU4WA95_9FUSO|nr:FAD-dependent oxidoreductase [Candidatus Cetobacterium colombiensis]MDX8335335.1 FAD-dependent oxidoreductase [Candidatus Cetobacterium colombiensis]
MTNETKYIYDAIIIGGGPAGVSAAIYIASRGYKPVILEKNEIGGTVGKVSSVTHYLSVDNYETGESFKNKLENQLKVYNIEVLKEEVVELKKVDFLKEVTTKSGKNYLGKSIVIANGTTPRSLGIPGEEEFLNKGLCSVPFREGKNYKGKDIFVVGGADGAIKEAIYLSQFAKTLSIIHFEDQLGTIAEFKNKLNQLSNVKVYLNSRLTNIQGDKCIENLEITNEKTKEVAKINSKGAAVFIYAGALPNTKEYKALELENGFIKTDNKMKTNIEGVFAAGDICCKEIRQVATAVSDGTIAGVNAAIYLNSL